MIRLCLATLLVLATTTSLVFAKSPDGSCICDRNGAQGIDSSKDYCACNLPSSGCNPGWERPFCTAPTGKSVTIGITFDNSTATKQFSADKAEEAIFNGLNAAAGGITWLSRVPQYEDDSVSPTAEVVILFLIKSEFMNTLHTEIYKAQGDTSKAAWTKTPYRMISMWQTGLRNAPASLMAQHFAKGNLLGDHSLGDSFSVTDAEKGATPATLQILDGHLEFFIATLVILVVVPLIEGLLYKFLHPSDEELDKEVEKHGGEEKVEELDRRRMKLGQYGDQVPTFKSSQRGGNPLFTQPVQQEELSHRGEIQNHNTETIAVQPSSDAGSIAAAVLVNAAHQVEQKA